MGLGLIFKAFFAKYVMFRRPDKRELQYKQTYEYI